MSSTAHERIDSHHHLWRYSKEEYGWIGPRMEGLAQDFLPDDLRPLLEQHDIAGTVAVQARQLLAETEWLLSLAHKYPFLRGVVGWVPLVDREVEKHLERFASDTKLKGVRHVLHDEPNEFYMLSDDFNRGLSRLKHHELVYDILIYSQHLPQTIELVNRHPSQLFVVDHMAKPAIQQGELSPWRERIAELAERDNVVCKLSGLVTEAHWNEWTAPELERYIDVVLHCFGPRRLMWGSDWPVLLVSASYRQWVDVVRQAIAGLSADEQGAIWGGTAARVYKL